MVPYQNLNGNSGIEAFEIGEDFIRIKFEDDGIYLYTYKSAGRQAIEEMKKRALEGRFLASYISQNIKKNFESKSD